MTNTPNNPNPNPRSGGPGGGNPRQGDRPPPGMGNTPEGGRESRVIHINRVAKVAKSRAVVMCPASVKPSGFL